MPYKLEHATPQDEARLRLAITMVEALAEVVAETLGETHPTTRSTVACALVHIAAVLVSTEPDAETRGQEIENLQRYFFEACQP